MSAEQRLAVAVLMLAAHDATTGSARRRDSAVAFLAGGPMLAFWCQLAGIHPATVQRSASRWTHAAA
jgi:hypothetical protein